MLETVELVQNIPHLSMLGNIPPEYQHHKRLVEPGTDISLANAYLKWYDIHRPELEISPELRQESRDFLIAEEAGGKLKLGNQLGFVELHRCDAVVFLFAATWCNVNELWRTVYYKDLLNGGGFQLVPMETHTPTYCVWELAPVWHEQQAWGRYLFSKRDEVAKYAYLNDRFSGLI